MLAVPATQGAFWVRFLMRSDAAIGMAEHNVFAGASTGNTPNDGTVEFAVSACSIYIFRSYKSFVDETRGVFGADSDVSSAMD